MVKPGGNFGNFINCVRTRNRNDLNAEILQGHLFAASATWAILLSVGQARPVRQVPQRLPGVPAGRRLDPRSTRTSAAQLGLDGLAKQTCQYGPKLQFDAQAERFVGCPAADALLTRKPCPPFVVPETV